MTGVQIDVSLVPGFVDPCSSGTNGIGQIIYSTEIQLLQDDGGQGGGIYLNYEGDTFARLILLDTANGREVIAVTAPDAASLEALVAEAMPVIESFEFIP